MSDTTAETMRRGGWSIVADDGFIDLIGPLWQRATGAECEFALIGQDKHRNRRGVVQGGAVMTLADRACGMVARLAAEVSSVATVQLDVHFVDAAAIGDLLVARPRVVRATRSLIFMTVDVAAEARIVATASGVFKVMRKPEPSANAMDR